LETKIELTEYILGIEFVHGRTTRIPSLRFGVEKHRNQKSKHFAEFNAEAI